MPDAPSPDARSEQPKSVPESAPPPPEHVVAVPTGNLAGKSPT